MYSNFKYLFAPENMKKRPQVAHNWPKKIFSPANWPKISPNLDFCSVKIAVHALLKYNVVFLDGDNFCKAFAGAQVNLSYYEWRSHE